MDNLLSGNCPKARGRHSWQANAAERIWQAKEMKIRCLMIQ